MKPSTMTGLRSIWHQFSNRIQEDASKQMVESLADYSKARQLLYTGPFNAFMQRLKWATVGLSGATIVGSPILLHYLGASSWSFGTNLCIFSAMSATSLAQSWLAHRYLSRYVLHAYKLVPTNKPKNDEGNSDISRDRLELVTMDMLGRPKRQIFSAYQLESNPEVGSLSIIGHPSSSFVVQLKSSAGFDYFSKQQHKR